RRFVHGRGRDGKALRLGDDRSGSSRRFAGHVPVVVVREQGGRLNAFVNVCRHRSRSTSGGPDRSFPTLITHAVIRWSWPRPTPSTPAVDADGAALWPPLPSQNRPPCRNRRTPRRRRGRIPLRIG